MKELQPETVLECIPQQTFRGQGVIPADLALFEDHFPGFPVLPGVLSLEILKCCIERCLGGGKVRLLRAANARFQHFLRPGETWECQVTRTASPQQGQSTWTGTLKVHAKRAMSAQLAVGPAF